MVKHSLVKLEIHPSISSLFPAQIPPISSCPVSLHVKIAYAELYLRSCLQSQKHMAAGTLTVMGRKGEEFGDCAYCNGFRTLCFCMEILETFLVF